MLLMVGGVVGKMLLAGEKKQMVIMSHGGNTCVFIILGPTVDLVQVANWEEMGQTQKKRKNSGYAQRLIFEVQILP